MRSLTSGNHFWKAGARTAGHWIYIIIYGTYNIPRPSRLARCALVASSIS
jgi:hypothetical protein